MRFLLVVRKFLLRFGQLCAFLLLLWGAVVVAFSGAALYVVVNGDIRPGELMFMGDPAPTIGESLLIIGVGALMIAGSIVCRSYIKSVLASMPSNYALKSGPSRQGRSGPLARR